MNIERIEEQLMGRHEACVVCSKCSEVIPISQVEDNARKEENALVLECSGCFDELFTVGLNERGREMLEYRDDIYWTLDVLDEIQNKISNVNTDKEIRNMNRKIMDYKKVLEDVKEEGGFLNTL